MTVYDAETRSQIQTDQDKAALRSMFELNDEAGHKSVDLFFGPQRPEGAEERWIKTVPVKGWFAYFRIYGPELAAFDKSCKLGDFEDLSAPPNSAAQGTSSGEASLSSAASRIGVPPIRQVSPPTFARTLVNGGRATDTDDPSSNRRADKALHQLCHISAFFRDVPCRWRIAG